MLSEIATISSPLSTLMRIFFDASARCKRILMEEGFMVKE
jgi:hypothetical protein